MKSAFIATEGDHVTCPADNRHVLRTARVPGILLASYVNSHGEPYRLLLDEPKVSRESVSGKQWRLQDFISGERGSNIPRHRLAAASGCAATMGMLTFRGGGLYPS